MGAIAQKTEETQSQMGQLRTLENPVLTLPEKVFFFVRTVHESGDFLGRTIMNRAISQGGPRPQLGDFQGRTEILLVVEL